MTQIKKKKALKLVAALMRTEGNLVKSVLLIAIVGCCLFTHPMIGFPISMLSAYVLQSVHNFLS